MKVIVIKLVTCPKERLKYVLCDSCGQDYSVL